ncbi:hypothetical protein OG552_33290 [Streptomyces sp. NBC_01476]|uniref:hypothetical protein n=1 Tax=Streptomyces sp. NBC_01476 TaxID=2903881 RepID=UPI002E2F38CE|nr:hypothetical protein [Streptomyces sp. NBC_01476]
MRPLLFLDVDGPLNPFEAQAESGPAGYVAHRMRPAGWDDPRLEPLRVWLNPDHGAALTALPFDLVWATTWGAQANEWIAPQIGLPPLPYVRWAGPVGYQNDGMYFKTRDLVHYAAGRPFSWVDDEIGPPDRAYVAGHHQGPALLHRIHPAVGLRTEDFRTLRGWAAELGAAAR